MHFAVTMYYTIISGFTNSPNGLLDSALEAPSLYLSLCVRCTLFIYLFACLVNFFLKFFHSLQFLTDYFHIAHVLFLGDSAFGLWSAWRYGDFWRFCDHQQNGLVYSDATN